MAQQPAQPFKDAADKALGKAKAGHNNDELVKDYVKKLCNIRARQVALRGEEKDLLNKAKADNILKTSLKNAVKELAMTPEQTQAKAEVDDETKRITALCKDLPLFKSAA